MRTGIFGGTFNPVHRAHLGIAEEVRRACRLDRVLFIPAATPPHKDVAGDVSFAHRLAMIEAALADHPGFDASDLEIRRSGKSYSVDTLDILAAENPDDTFFFIIGQDSYRDIASWKDYPRLFALSHIVVVTRPEVDIDSPLSPLPVAMHGEFCYDDRTKKLHHKSGKYVLFLAETNLPISSTDIRRRLRGGQPVNHLVPQPVADYIAQHCLYRTP